MQVLIDQNKYFSKVMDRYKYFIGDEQARLAYQSRQKFLHDQASYLADAREMGLEAGRAQGREEGRDGKKVKQKGLQKECPGEEGKRNWRLQIG